MGGVGGCWCWWLPGPCLLCLVFKKQGFNSQRDHSGWSERESRGGVEGERKKREGAGEGTKGRTGGRGGKEGGADGSDELSVA